MGTGTGTGQDVSETPRDLFGYLDGVGDLAGSVRFGLVRNWIALRGVLWFWVDEVDMVERERLRQLQYFARSFRAREPVLPGTY